MRLAFCIFKYFPYGGLERDFLRVANECINRGYEIDIFTRSWKGEIPKNLSINYISSKGFSNHKKCQRFVKKLQNKLTQGHYDAVIGFNKMPGLDIYLMADICFKAKAYTHHSFLYRLLPRYKVYTDLEQAVFSCTSSTKILTYKSDELKNYVSQYRTPASRFHLIPPDQLSSHTLLDKNDCRKKLEAELKFSADKLTLMVGSHFKTKGLDRSLYALAALPTELKNNTKLLIAGQGKIKPFASLAKKLGVAEQVLFLGPRSDVLELMSAADLLLHPSYYESSGKVLLEALSVGLPVLVTENCGFAFHVKNANAGIVIPMPFQQKQLNTSLQSMLISNHSYSWHENALNYMQRLPTADIAKKAVDFIENYVNQIRLQRENFQDC